MFKKYLLWVALIVFLFSISITCVAGEAPLELITAQEAATPDMAPGYFEAGRELEDGPIVEVISPQNGKTYKPPIQIMVRFSPKDGREIDLSTLRVEYLKLLTIDLTPRVKPYTTEDGINVPLVKLPPGIHTIRLIIGDVTGAVTEQVFTVEVL